MCASGLVLPAEWIRLVKDPAVRQIQLTGDIAFSPDLFPHEHSNDRTKGVNVSHNVSLPSSHPPVLPGLHARDRQAQAAREGVCEQPAEALRRRVCLCACRSR